MSNSAPSGDTSPSAAPPSTAPEIEAEPATTDTGTRLVLPNPLPDDANPFRVIDWILFTAHVAACHLTDARRARVGQLGRKMRTEDRGGVLMLHCEDDLDWRAVEKELTPQLNDWWKAHSDARNLCAEHGIPFGVYDPLLKAAWDKLEETWSIIRGVASDREVYFDNDINRQLHELADSTTPTPAVPAPLPNRTQQDEEEKPPADPYADLRQFARADLKGQERAVIEALCDAGGELPIADLAVKDGVGWHDPFNGFRNAQQRLNPKLKPLGWTLARQNNAAKLNPMKS